MLVPVAIGDDQGVRKIDKKDEGTAEKPNAFFASVFTAELKRSSLSKFFYEDSMRTASCQRVPRKYFKTSWLMNKNKLHGPGGIHPNRNC